MFLLLEPIRAHLRGGLQSPAVTRLSTDSSGSSGLWATRIPLGCSTFPVLSPFLSLWEELEAVRRDPDEL